MMLTCDCEPLTLFGATDSEAAGCCAFEGFPAASPEPRRPCCAAEARVTVVSPWFPPVTMARSMLATPGTVTTVSLLLLTCLSSAQACLRGKTRMVTRLVWACSMLAMACLS